MKKAVCYIPERTRTKLIWQLKADKPLNLNERKVEVFFLSSGSEPIEANFNVTYNGVNVIIPADNDMPQNKYSLCMMIDKNLESEKFFVLLDALQVVPVGSMKCAKEYSFTSKYNK